MPSNQPSNRDIFRLFCSLEKGELRNLRVLLGMEGRYELVHSHLLDELYKLRGSSFEAGTLCKKLACEKQTLRRSMVRIYGLALQSRLHYHPDPRESLAKTIADVRYLIRKGLADVAEKELEKGLLYARKLEFFDLELELMHLRIGLPHLNQAEIENLQVAIRVADKKRNIMRDLESLSIRLKGVRQGPSGNQNLLKVRSLVGHRILQDAEKCLSTRARILFHDLNYRLQVFLGAFEAGTKHLHEKIVLLERDGRTLQIDERELLQSRIALSRLLFEQGKTQAALRWSSIIWNCDLSNAVLEPIRFEAYTVSMLAYAADHCDILEGNAVMRIVRDQWDTFSVGLRAEKRTRLRFMAMRFLLLSGQYEELMIFSSQTDGRDLVAGQIFDTYCLALELMAAIASDSIEKTIQFHKRLRKKLSANTGGPFLGIPKIQLLARKYLGARVHEFKSIMKSMLEDIPRNDSYEMQALRFDSFLKGLLLGWSVFDLDAQSVEKDRPIRFIAGN